MIAKVLKMENERTFISDQRENKRTKADADQPSCTTQINLTNSRIDENDFNVWRNHDPAVFSKMLEKAIEIMPRFDEQVDRTETNLDVLANVTTED